MSAGGPITAREIDGAHTDHDSGLAAVYALDFSEASKVDGLMSKADEFAAVVQFLCRHENVPKIDVVAHSAGGLVARLYLQNSMRSTPYRQDIDRLITIATPHLGSVLASWFHPFLGPRAYTLKYDHPRISTLGSDLDLPDDVRIASLVIRGCRRDTDDEGTAYESLANDSLLKTLPPDFQFGGDEVVHVRSQNLALTPAAIRYEQRTGRPLQYACVRIDPGSDLIHVACLHNARVHRWLTIFLSSAYDAWSSAQSVTRFRLKDHQAYWQGFDIAEEEYDRQHHILKVTPDLQSVEFEKKADEFDVYRFRFEGKWYRPLFGDGRSVAAGQMWVRFDEFSRVRECRYKLTDQRCDYVESFPEYAPLTRATIWLQEGLPILALTRLNAEQDNSEQQCDTLAECYRQFAHRQQSRGNWWGAYRSIRLLNQHPSASEGMKEGDLKIRQRMAEQIANFHEQRVRAQPTVADYLVLATLHHHEGRPEQAMSVLNAAKSLVSTPDEHAAFKATENLILGESTKSP